MKRVIYILLSGVLFLGIVSCQAKETITEGSITTPKYSSEETFIPSRTNKPVLSEQDKKIVSKYNELLYYCQNYNDWYAALLLKEMLDKEEITLDQFSALFDIDFFNKAKEFDDKLWKQIQNQLEDIANIINGQQNNINETDMNNCYNYLCSATQQNTIFLTMFESKETIDRLILTVNDLHIWFNSPTEDNFIPIKKKFLSEDMTSGEIIMLSCYLYNSPKLPSEVQTGTGNVDSSTYLDEQGIKNCVEEAMRSLLT